MTKFNASNLPTAIPEGKGLVIIGPRPITKTVLVEQLSANYLPEDVCLIEGSGSLFQYPKLRTIKRNTKLVIVTNVSSIGTVGFYTGNVFLGYNIGYETMTVDLIYPQLIFTMNEKFTIDSLPTSSHFNDSYDVVDLFDTNPKKHGHE